MTFSIKPTCALNCCLGSSLRSALPAVRTKLLRTNKLLRKKIRELQTTDLVDPVTGLGNLKIHV